MRFLRFALPMLFFVVPVLAEAFQEQGGEAASDTEAAKMEDKILNLAARCGSEIDWVDTWEEASNRAKKLNRLILVRIRLYPEFNIADEARSGPFMDQDLIALINNRFVPLNFARGSDAPFVSQESYGIGPSACGSSILISLPDGRIVGDTASIESASLHDFLLRQLSGHPALSVAAPPPEGFDRLDIAEWYMQRAEYEKAMKFVESATTVRGLDIEAALLRRMRRGPEALLAIRKAETLTEGGDLAETWLDEAILLMKMDRIDEASVLLDRVMTHEPACARKPEAIYRQGACLLRLTGDKAETERLWKSLIRDHEESRWAWKAAVSLKSTESMMGETGRLDWPPEAVIAANWAPAPEPLEPSRADKAEEDALAFLLRTQRDDGSWICPSATMNTNDDEPDNFTQAVTAICGQSLIAYNDDPDAHAAITRAIAYLGKIRVEEKKRSEPLFFMDLTFWKNSYVLWFFADCVLAGVMDVDQLGNPMSEIVAELDSIQNDWGGWSYLITTDLEAATEKPLLSMSFVTAQLSLALMDAKSAGANVPDEMIEAALGCLEMMRNPDGTFEYMVNHALENARGNTSPEGAAGRGPLCELALYLGGRCETGRIRRALDLFVQHRRFYAKEQGKTLMHAGPHGEGSHYLMFDYAYAAEAISHLPEEARDPFRQALLEQILSMRTQEGSYVDNPLLGRYYGTAMALIAFQYLGA